MRIKTIIDQSERTIIDVRTHIEFKTSHIKGAINIPLNRIMTSRDEIRRMTTPIIVYCRSGSRSQQAKLLLNASGIKEVYNGGSLQEMSNLLAEKSEV